ncbi:MAG TPA: hypothetical protein VGY97_03660 [Solirubrobacteraceae bacterium]|nr:hypothetical protein [Solirubrobacteraceae bacterium]
MARILIVANETIGGQRLRQAVLDRARQGASFVICVPRGRPRHGALIYDEAVYDAAQVRVDLARSFLREQGVEAIGEVGDPDPYTAAMDAVRDYSPSEIIISTHPETRSGWLRRSLVDRLQEATGLPVEHIVTDLDREGLPFKVTLVVANRTASNEALLERLRAKAVDGEHVFIVVVPQEGGGGQAAAAARGRLGQVLALMRGSHLLSAGIIGDPDPYTAIMNALQFFRVDDIVISTFGETRSGWLRADLIERVRRSTPLPVEHIVADRESAKAS